MSKIEIVIEIIVEDCVEKERIREKRNFRLCAKVKNSEGKKQELSRSSGAVCCVKLENARKIEKTKNC